MYRFFIYKPSGRELKPKLVSAPEILFAALILIGSGVATGLICLHKLEVSREHSVILGFVAVLTTLVGYYLTRSFLVRAGYVHPVGSDREDQRSTGSRRS